MIRCARSMGKLSFSRLMQVYEEGNREKANMEWPDLSPEMGLAQAEQDFYQYLDQVFFVSPGSCCWILEEAGEYVSALRLEPYRDGLLLTALETVPRHRRKGYAKLLVRHVLTQYPRQKIYSHVHKQNLPSLKLHYGCGFEKISDSAIYLDGSFNARCCTLCYEQKEPCTL